MRVGSGLLLTMIPSATKTSTLLIGRCSTSMQSTVCLLMKISSYYSFMRKRSRSSTARGGLVFAFNFHPTESVTDWRIPVPERADYRLVLNTDDTAFGGHGAVEGVHYPWQDVAIEGQAQSIQLYVPARSAQVLVSEKSQIYKQRIGFNNTRIKNTA